jgi:hypothetical protein
MRNENAMMLASSSKNQKKPNKEKRKRRETQKKFNNVKGERSIKLQRNLHNNN